jgi:hypothetical protein
MATDVDKLLRQGGKIYISTNYDENTFTYSQPTDTNLDTNIALIESQNTFQALAYFQNFNVNHAREDEQTTIFDDCDKGSEVSARFTPSFNYDLFGVNDFPLMRLILNTALLNVAGTLVTGATQDIVNPSAYLNFYPIANQNFDGSIISITSITGSVDGAIVAGTDYNEITNGLGIYGVEFISG